MRDDHSIGKPSRFAAGRIDSSAATGTTFALHASSPDAWRGMPSGAGSSVEGTWTESMEKEVQARFVAAIDNNPLVAVQSFTRDGIVRVWNKASEQLYGITREEAVGRHFHDLLQFHDPDADFPGQLAALWDSGQPLMPRDWKITTASGKQVWVYSTLFPVSENGTTIEIYCLDIDITLRKGYEQRLTESEERFQQFFQRSPDAIILLQDGQFHEFNQAALRLFGFIGQQDMQGIASHNVSPRHQPDGSPSGEKMEEMHQLALAAGSHQFEWQYCNRDKQPFWADVTLTKIDAQGKTLTYAILHDITARKEAEKALRLSAQVFENSHEGIVILDKNWRIVSTNTAFANMTGFDGELKVGAGKDVLKSVLHDQAAFEAMAERLRRHDHWQGEIWIQRKDRQAFPAWASLSTVRNDNRRICNYIVIFSDISERKAAEERIRHLSEHDFLTGLPNRVLLLDRLQLAIAAARRNRSKLAVMFLDLDRFKNINDSLGHHIGGRLLQAVAERLKKCVRGNDTVSRQGGDEFVVMLTDIGDIDQVAHIAGNILQTVNMPYQIEEHALSIGTCIGISVYPEDGPDIDTLIRNADTAMYHAKDNGRNNYQFFSQEMNVRIAERLTLEYRLRAALEQNQFSLAYQPEIDMGSGKPIGAEALLRWHHPDAGLMLPEHFLTVAEECGLIVPIGDWVLENACMQARMWHDQGMPVAVGVNLSAVQFRQKDFVEKVQQVLEKTRLPARYLELEITESILIDTAPQTLDTMYALRDLGVMLAVDDFGTGYSSLSYLKHFPVNKLKIDQSFVRDLSDDANDAAIIRAILIMAKSLKLKVVAEGVETGDQLAFLQSHGCDQYQGYYVERPVSPSQLERFWRTH